MLNGAAAFTKRSMSHLEAVAFGANLCKLVVGLLVLADGILKLGLQGLLVIHQLLQLAYKTHQMVQLHGY